MGRSRLDLDAFLRKLIEYPKVKIYFDPPEDVKMEYPCIVYNFDGVYSRSANNSKNYIKRDQYTITLMSEDPDWSLPEVFMKLPYCHFDRPYIADNLHHWVFSLYY